MGNNGQKLECCTGWGPSSLAKLVQITIITIVYDRQITIFRWGYKPTNITGGPHPVACCSYWPTLLPPFISLGVARASIIHADMARGAHHIKTAWYEPARNVYSWLIVGNYFIFGKNLKYRKTLKKQLKIQMHLNARFGVFHMSVSWIPKSPWVESNTLCHGRILDDLGFFPF